MLWRSLWLCIFCAFGAASQAALIATCQPPEIYRTPSLTLGSIYGIYANIWGILMVNVTIYSSTMDPMGKGPWSKPEPWLRWSWAPWRGTVWPWRVTLRPTRSSGRSGAMTWQTWGMVRMVTSEKLRWWNWWGWQILRINKTHVFIMVRMANIKNMSKAFQTKVTTVTKSN